MNLDRLLGIVADMKEVFGGGGRGLKINPELSLLSGENTLFHHFIKESKSGSYAGCVALNLEIDEVRALYEMIYRRHGKCF